MEIAEIITNSLGVSREKIEHLKVIAIRQYNVIYQFKYNQNYYVAKKPINYEKKKDDISSSSFLKEYLILDFLSKKKIPVPKVIFYSEERGKEILIQEKLEGIESDEFYHNSSPEQKEKILKVITKIMKKIHSIDIKEMQYIFDKLPDLEHSVDSRRSYEKKIENYLEKCSNTFYKNELIELLEDVKDNSIKTEQVLMHNDLGIRANNILFKYGSNGEVLVTGVIDWERFKLGDPLEEICRFEMELVKSFIARSLEGKISSYSKPLAFEIKDLYGMDIQKRKEYKWFEVYTYILPGKWYLSK